MAAMFSLSAHRDRWFLGADVIYMDLEDYAYITRTPGQVNRLKAAIEAEMARASVVVLSDYTKGVLTDEILRFAIASDRSGVAWCCSA